MITLRNDFATFARRADAKIGLLKEIIERIKNGEEVDVEGLLGTGDPQREKEWEEGMGPLLCNSQISSNMIPVLQEIEEEDAAWEESRKRKPKQEESISSTSQPANTPERLEDSKPTKGNGPVGFY